MKIKVGNYVIPYFDNTVVGYEVIEVKNNRVTYLNDGLKINEPIDLIESVLPF